MMLHDVADLVTGQAASKVEEVVLLKDYEYASITSRNHPEGHKQPEHTKWKCLCSGCLSGAWFLSPAAHTGAVQAAARLRERDNSLCVAGCELQTAESAESCFSFTSL